MATSVVRVGSTMPVTGPTTALRDGRWIAIREGIGLDDDHGMFMQIYSAAGTPVGSEVRVNTTTDLTQTGATIASLTNGGWVITWSGNGTQLDNADVYGVFQQAYNPDGTRNGTETRVNVTPDGEQYLQQVTGLADGGWVVTWTDFSADTTGGNISQRVFNEDGTPRGGQVLVNTTTSGLQFRPTVVALPQGSENNLAGGWIVVWEGNGSGDGQGIFQQTYSASGQPVGSETVVNTTVAMPMSGGDQQNPHVTALNDGRWVVTWAGYGIGDNLGIFQQIFNADGSRDGSEVRVNTSTSLNQFDPTVTALSNGGWVVTWHGNGVNDDNGVFQQVYAANGTKVGTETRIHLETTGGQVLGGVSALSGGGWISSWAGDDAEGNWGYYLQSFRINNDPTGVKINGNETLTVFESLGPGSEIGALSAIDVDTSALDERFAYQIVNASGDPISSALFEIVGSTSGEYSLKLRPGVTFDYENPAHRSHLLKIKVVDAAGAAYIQDVTINLANLNERPSDIGVSNSTVAENTASGTAIGTFHTADPDADEAFTYSLVGDGAGGRFAVKENTLFVSRGAALDYEMATSHQIIVRVTDRGGLSFDKTLTVYVSDIQNEVVAGSSAGEKILGGSGKDKLSGGLGNDFLTGGKGKDAFVFDTRPNKLSNVDKITDFKVLDDSIWLENKFFSKLGKSGSESKPSQMKKEFFTIGNKAKDKNDYIIYDNKKGVLYYDADGSGKSKGVEFASLSKNLKMTYKDFFIV